ncbi:MAG: 23S rRNA (uracil(1939)-C(5))-methyltransferase RlmD [Eubacteriales bacterium]|nr:23S rRNA (uracil(1939)-C(5))-methyltransferase RlmD [Eubacteriales bacterium]
MNMNTKAKNENISACKYAKKCGGCDYQGLKYEETLDKKQKKVKELFKGIIEPEPIIGMYWPYHYRNKVHAVFDYDGKNVISGIYEERTHKVVNIEKCMIEDELADEIILTIKGMLKSFKIKTYNEDTGYGIFRHVMVRRGFSTGQVMVILVLSTPILPSKNNFVKALLKAHPEINTVVLNVNDKDTSMVLGDRNIVLYGKGYIEDVLCGLRFRISPNSFYQINSQQTEKLYKKAMEFASLSGKETVIDAYCGIGTIGMTASKKAKEVIGVELNADAVKDAKENARLNNVKNIRFFEQDASDFMTDMAENENYANVVFMDPPRSGSTEKFIDAVSYLNPDRVVYISCNPETQVRDIKYFKKKGYEVKKLQPVDLFPWTEHVETVCLMSRE